MLRAPKGTRVVAVRGVSGGNVELCSWVAMWH